MDKFAKLFETDLGQIVILLDTNEDYNPQVLIMFKPEGLGVCKVALNWDDDSDESWDLAERALSEMTEDKAYGVVKATIENIGKLGKETVEDEQRTSN